MSTIDGINQPVGVTPASTGAAAADQNSLGGLIKRTYKAGLAAVFEQGKAGEFDDPTVRLQEQAAIQRLRIAQQEAAASGALNGRPVTGGGGAAVTGGTRTSPMTGARGSNGARTASSAVVAAEREVLAVRRRQAEHVMASVEGKLAARFPQAAARASIGDVAKYVPKSEQEAVAFSQRLVIDMTVGAARLEVLRTQVESAILEAEVSGTPEAMQLAQRLKAEWQAQQAAVVKLSTIADLDSQGAISAIGAAALSGQSGRAAGELPVGEIARNARESGLDERVVDSVVGASEIAVEEATTPVGTPTRLTTISKALVDFYVRCREHLIEERRVEDRKQQDQQRLQRKDDEKRSERNRQNEAAWERSESRTAEFRRWGEQSAAKRRSMFQEMLAAIDARRSAAAPA